MVTGFLLPANSSMVFEFRLLFGMDKWGNERYGLCTYIHIIDVYYMLAFGREFHVSLLHHTSLTNQF